MPDSASNLLFGSVVFIFAVLRGGERQEGKQVFFLFYIHPFVKNIAVCTQRAIQMAAG